MHYRDMPDDVPPFPESGAGMIVVIGFQYYVGAPLHCNQIPEVLASVVTFGDDPRQFQIQLLLAINAPEITACKAELEGRPGVSDNYEIDVMLSAPFGK